MTTVKAIVNVAAIIFGIVLIAAGGTDTTLALGGILIVLGVNNL